MSAWVSSGGCKQDPPSGVGALTVLFCFPSVWKPKAKHRYRLWNQTPWIWILLPPKKLFNVFLSFFIWKRGASTYFLGVLRCKCLYLWTWVGDTTFLNFTLLSANLWQRDGFCLLHKVGRCSKVWRLLLFCSFCFSVFRSRTGSCKHQSETWCRVLVRRALGLKQTVTLVWWRCD